MKPNPFTERPDAILVIKFAGTFSLLGLILVGVLALMHVENSIAHDVAMLVSGSITGLVGLLASTKPAQQMPTGTPSDPVSVAGASPEANAPPVETQDALKAQEGENVSG